MLHKQEIHRKKRYTLSNFISSWRVIVIHSRYTVFFLFFFYQREFIIKTSGKAFNTREIDTVLGPEIYFLLPTESAVIVPDLHNELRKSVVYASTLHRDAEEK